MDNKQIKKILLVLSIAIFVLWFLPTVIYTFDSDVSDYIKDAIKETIPNVYHLIFGGKKGDYEFTSIPGAGWIFAIQLVVTIVLFIGVNDQSNNAWLDIVPAGLFVFLSGAFFSLASGQLNIGKVSGYRMHINISVWGTILIYICSTILCFGLFVDINMNMPTIKNPNKIVQSRINNLPPAAIIDKLVKDTTMKKTEKLVILRNLFDSGKITKETYLDAYKKM